MSVSDAVYPLRTFNEIITISLTATNVTGSSIISGSNVYGATAKLTNVTATTVTGSTSISGSAIQGKTALVQDSVTVQTATTGYLIAQNVTGSLVVSGSSILGKMATIQDLVSVTNVVATNVTGSSIVSGSSVYGAYALITTVSGSSISAAGGTFSPPTGSVSGSLVDAMTVAVNITGSTYYIRLWK